MPASLRGRNAGKEDLKGPQIKRDPQRACVYWWAYTREINLCMKIGERDLKIKFRLICFYAEKCCCQLGFSNS